MKKTIAVVWMLLLMGMTLTGCSKVKFEPEGSCIFIQKNASVIGYTEETGFDKGYYSIEELTGSYVEPAVMEYNSQNANLAFAYEADTEERLPVAIETLEIKDGVAVMQLAYTTAADYLAFNENQLGEEAVFTVCPLADAASGRDADWVKDAEGTAVDAETALTAKKNCCFVELDFATTVQVEGKLLYLSGNAEWVNENTFVSDGEDTVYAVFKK